MVRVNDRGEVIVSVSVRCKRFRAVHGALMLSTQGDDIDQMVTRKRLAILKVFGIAAIVMIVLSLLLASTIAGPVRRLADSAEHVRRRIRPASRSRFLRARRRDRPPVARAARHDRRVYNRIEGIERFAADVAHELKNPLTSMRSAVETLPLARSDDSRARLLAVIEHDVRRLDRLISDISDASRLDAELQRGDVAPVELRRLLTTLTSVANETRLGHDVAVEIRFEGGPADTFSVPGHDSRLGQVISNLLANAQSFSQPGGKVRIHLPPPQIRDRDPDRRRRPRHPPRRAGEDLRALLYRPAAPGLRTEFGIGIVDLQADHRGAWRAHLGGESSGAARRRGRCAHRRRALRGPAARDMTVRP